MDLFVLAEFDQLTGPVAVLTLPPLHKSVGGVSGISPAASSSSRSLVSPASGFAAPSHARASIPPSHTIHGGGGGGSDSDEDYEEHQDPSLLSPLASSQASIASSPGGHVTLPPSHVTLSHPLDLAHLALQVLGVETQDTSQEARPGPTDAREDVQLALHVQSHWHVLAHVCRLPDFSARGFGRAVAVIYVTSVSGKIMFELRRVRAELQAISLLLKEGARRTFLAALVAKCRQLRQLRDDIEARQEQLGATDDEHEPPTGARERSASISYIEEDERTTLARQHTAVVSLLERYEAMRPAYETPLDVSHLGIELDSDDSALLSPMPPAPKPWDIRDLRFYAPGAKSRALPLRQLCQTTFNHAWNCVHHALTELRGSVMDRLLQRQNAKASVPRHLALSFGSGDAVNLRLDALRNPQQPPTPSPSPSPLASPTLNPAEDPVEATLRASDNLPPANPPVPSPTAGPLSLTTASSLGAQSDIASVTSLGSLVEDRLSRTLFPDGVSEMHEFLVHFLLVDFAEFAEPLVASILSGRPVVVRSPVQRRFYAERTVRALSMLVPSAYLPIESALPPAQGEAERIVLWKEWRRRDQETGLEEGFLPSNLHLQDLAGQIALLAFDARVNLHPSLKSCVTLLDLEEMTLSAPDFRSPPHGFVHRMLQTARFEVTDRAKIEARASKRSSSRKIKLADVVRRPRKVSKNPNAMPLYGLEAVLGRALGGKSKAFRREVLPEVFVQSLRTILLELASKVMLYYHLCCVGIAPEEERPPRDAVNTSASLSTPVRAMRRSSSFSPDDADSDSRSDSDDAPTPERLRQSPHAVLKKLACFDGDAVIIQTLAEHVKQRQARHMYAKAMAREGFASTGAPVRVSLVKPQRLQLSVEAQYRFMYSPYHSHRRRHSLSTISAQSTKSDAVYSHHLRSESSLAHSRSRSDDVRRARDDIHLF